MGMASGLISKKEHTVIENYVKLIKKPKGMVSQEAGL